MADTPKDQMMVELEADIAEFKELLSTHAKRPNVKKVLEGWVRKCEAEKQSMEKLLEQQQPKKIVKKEEEK